MMGCDIVETNIVKLMKENESLEMQIDNLKKNINNTNSVDAANNMEKTIFNLLSRIQKNNDIIYEQKLYES
jgi:cell division septum initiation protein DivIVA